MSNVFNDDFSSIGSRLANNLPESLYQLDDFLGPYVNGDFVPVDTNELEVLDLIGDLSDASAGYDSVPTHLIKKIKNEIVKPLTHICNISFQTGVFPSQLKQSKVIPLHKGGTKSDLHNYRPISLLSVFSKIIEKLMYMRFEIFLEDNEVLIDQQYGFRKKKSTTGAILRLTDYILKSFDERKFVIAAFLGLSKAFDTVDHNVLITKLNYIGVRGVALDWFVSYLHERKQFTVYKNVYSNNKRQLTRFLKGLY